MKVVRLTLGLVIIGFAVGCAVAFLLVTKRESEKLKSVAVEMAQLTGDAERGEYVASMGGCIACHTATADGGNLMAGGVPLETPFGTFYSPNITSDETAGIGGWTNDEFIRAMTLGRSPENQHYFPAFPYTSYSAMSVQDLLDLKAWLDSVEPAAKKAPAHDVAWPLTFRRTLVFWKAMFFNPQRVTNIASRGDYLVNGPSHCAECHSPRNLLGGLSGRSLTGNTRGPSGEAVPGITARDLIDWALEDLELFLEVGMTPSGDFAGGHMTDVIEYGTSQLTVDDRHSIALYLLSDANKP